MNLPRGSGLTSALRSVSSGSSSVLCGESLRSLASSHPLCTNVSLPSGRTSETVTWRSTSGVEASIQAWSAPAPTTTVFAGSGAVTYETAVPAGFWVQ